MLIKTLITLSIFLVCNYSSAATINLNPGDSIQTAIDNANDGDVINLAKGNYRGDIDFKGKAISIVGVGRRSVIRGTGDNPVVSFISGENGSAILDQVTVRGGNQAGGILIRDSSPRITRSYIINNRSQANGSGIFVTGNSSAPNILNNVLANNRVSRGGGDPHTIHITNASPILINNTIIRGDSNGIFVSGSSNPRITSNIMAYNGRGSRGRGICFQGVNSASEIRVEFNLFFRNRKGAIFINGTDFDTSAEAEQSFNDTFSESIMASNLDANPRFRNRRRLNLRLRANSPAIDAGDPSTSLNDEDNSRNDIGASGGPNPVF